jgi:hypothetical protein
MRKILTTAFVKVFVLILIGCMLPMDEDEYNEEMGEEEIFSSNKEITSFSFLAVQNASLVYDVTGTISDTDITLLVPDGTNMGALIACF